MVATPVLGRSPHGERGLKSSGEYGSETFRPSLPSRGAWIEIPLVSVGSGAHPVAPLTGSVD